MNPIVIVLVILYIIWCYSTANYHAKKRKVDVLLGTLLCVFLSPLIGGFILVSYPEKLKGAESIKSKIQPKQVVLDSATKIASTQDQVIQNKPAATPPGNLATKQKQPSKSAHRKKGVIIISFLVGIFLILSIMMNPDYNSFKEFTPDHTTKRHYALRTRLHNYLIFSVYEIAYFDVEEGEDEFRKSSKRYIGFMKNFYEK